MKKKTRCESFLVSSSSFWSLEEEGNTAVLRIVEFEKMHYTEFQQGMVKGRNRLFIVSVMENYIMQWKVTPSAMEKYTECNGKFRLVQWKVSLYNLYN